MRICFRPTRLVAEISRSSSIVFDRGSSGREDRWKRHQLHYTRLLTEEQYLSSVLFDRGRSVGCQRFDDLSAR